MYNAELGQEAGPSHSCIGPDHPQPEQRRTQRPPLSALPIGSPCHHHHEDAHLKEFAAYTGLQVIALIGIIPFQPLHCTVRGCWGPWRDARQPGSGMAKQDLSVNSSPLCSLHLRNTGLCLRESLRHSPGNSCGFCSCCPLPCKFSQLSQRQIQPLPRKGCFVNAEHPSCMSQELRVVRPVRSGSSSQWPGAGCWCW